MQLRLAGAADVAALADVHREAIVGTYGAIYSDEVIAAWIEGHTVLAWTQRLQRDITFVVAERDGVLVGCGGLAGHRTGVHVHPSAQRRGVGRAVFERLERLARDRGLGTLELSAPESAVPFYAALGFEPIAPCTHEFRDGLAITTYDMRKVIGAPR